MVGQNISNSELAQSLSRCPNLPRGGWEAVSLAFNKHVRIKSAQQALGPAEAAVEAVASLPEAAENTLLDEATGQAGEKPAVKAKGKKRAAKAKRRERYLSLISAAASRRRTWASSQL